MIISNATRDELIALGKRLLEADSEEETSELYAEFKSHFSHPDAANLFYWPEGYDFRRNEPKIADYKPTVEEVVDIAIDHKPEVTLL